MMSISDLAQRYPQVVGAIAAVLILGSLFVIFKPNQRDVPMAYFMDMGSGELISHDGSAPPPITTSSGAEGVLAHVYSCGACSPDSLTIGYLVKFVGAADEAANMRVASPDARDVWQSVETPEGVAIVESVNVLRKSCSQGFTECLP